ncbi:MAG: 2-isopropylmalate synthase [Pseudomonadota bacterium]|jgi:2-isopropylmalate synthase|nr:2-isopropylmalate synthase [Hyphomicrobiales bacterium]MEC7890239.1 2-isopropylmalate synthase [Pseudomonadota bacterium]|tara:strand:- start:787 stop:2334 length:1548 start_codon:yes stop_codon:yes gene_type:complete
MNSKDNYIKIFDTTLRDGEQSPGASMSLEEKIQIAEIFDEMGVDIIEAGFPIASNGDFESVKEVSRIVKNVQVCGLSRAGQKDIDRAAEALKYAKNPRIHTFISTSPVHMQYKLQMNEQEVLDAINFSVSRARNLVEDVQWSAEDATRTDRDFLFKCVDMAISSGATTINIPDTVGYTTPDEYYEIIDSLIKNIPDSDKVIFSTHCHNDLGLAVANSLSGVRAGARQIECTMNGIGERAGNAALEEIVMSMKVRNDILDYDSGVETKLFTRASKLVSSVTSFPVQFNKAIVGKNAFAHESGIHQDGMLKNNETYEIMTPESIGLNESTLVMGKHSGRHAFKEKAKELGYVLADNQLNDAFYRFKDLADKKKEVFDDDIVALIDDEFSKGLDVIKLVSLSIYAGTEGPQFADLSLEIDGEVKQNKSEGDGPVDALFNSIRTLIPHTASLQLYQVHAVTEGTDAQAEVSVRLHESGKTVIGRGADTDTLVASARAYISALNRLMVKREKSIPEEIAN